MAKFLPNARSQVCKPGPQMLSRPAVPKGVLCGTNADVLNHSAALGFARFGETPCTTSARICRLEPIAQLAQAALEIVIGRPVRQFQIPSNCQPPSAASTGRGAEFNIFRPRPNGN